MSVVEAWATLEIAGSLVGLALGVAWAVAVGVLAVISKATRRR